VVVPTAINNSWIKGKNLLVISVGNISYLATIGELIKNRVSTADFDCLYIERLPEEIDRIIDEASQAESKNFCLEETNSESEKNKNVDSQADRDFNDHDQSLDDYGGISKARKNYLKELKGLLIEELIDEDEYKNAKRKILEF